MIKYFIGHGGPSESEGQMAVRLCYLLQKAGVVYR
jgi:hypothetical protein